MISLIIATAVVVVPARAPAIARPVPARTAPARPAPAQPENTKPPTVYVVPAQPRAQCKEKECKQ